MNMQQANNSLSTVAHQEKLWFRFLFVAAFGVLLMIALSASVVGLKWRSWFPGAQEVTPLLGSVKAAVNSSLPLMWIE
jgi:hypothetical protein